MMAVSKRKRMDSSDEEIQRSTKREKKNFDKSNKEMSTKTKISKKEDAALSYEDSDDDVPLTKMKAIADSKEPEERKSDSSDDENLASSRCASLSQSNSGSSSSSNRSSSSRSSAGSDSDDEPTTTKRKVSKDSKKKASPLKKKIVALKKKRAVRKKTKPVKSSADDDDDNSSDDEPLSVKRKKGEIMEEEDILSKMSYSDVKKDATFKTSSQSTNTSEDDLVKNKDSVEIDSDDEPLAMKLKSSESDDPIVREAKDKKELEDLETGSDSDNDVLAYSTFSKKEPASDSGVQRKKKEIEANKEEPKLKVVESEEESSGVSDISLIDNNDEEPNKMDEGKKKERKSSIAKKSPKGGAKPSGKIKKAKEKTRKGSGSGSGSKTDKENDGKGKAGKKVDELAPLKRYLRVLGKRVNYVKLFEEIPKIKDQKAKLKELLASFGIEGRPTLEKCKKQKIRLDTAAEVASLDLSNIIDSRQKRSNVSAQTAASKRREGGKTPSKIKEKEDDEEDDNDDEDEVKGRRLMRLNPALFDADSD